MGATPNPNRRRDVQLALKRAKEGDMLSFQDLAFIWGTTSGPFSTVRRRMPGFPDEIRQGTQFIFPAKAALKAMLDYETRNDAAQQDQVRRRNAILGADRKADDASNSLPARELQILNRMATEIEERERAQREYIPAAEVAAVAGEVFSALSEFIGGLSNAIDPNGLLSPGLREMIDTNGSTALLGFHKTLKLLLDADVVAGSSRGAPDSARKPRTRRKRA